ncbi:MAG: thioredoxin domain-containing protein [Bdellovibrionota bacterium]
MRTWFAVSAFSFLVMACTQSPPAEQELPPSEEMAAAEEKEIPAAALAAEVKGEKLKGGIFSILSVPGASAQSASAPPPPLDPAKLDTEKILRRVRGEYEEELPPGASLSIEGVRPGPVPGLGMADLVISVSGQKKSQAIFFSSDGKFVSVFQFYRVEGASASTIPGFKTLRLKDLGGEETKDFFVSDDGSVVTLGDFWDTSLDPAQARMKKISLDKSPVRGKKGAKVVLVEFSDFQCPYCSRAQQLIAQRIYPEYKDKVEFRFKQLPLSFHDWARPAANASLCVADKDGKKFWEAYNFLFDNQRQINSGNVDSKIKEMAKKVGIDGREFDACYKERRFDQQVQKDMDDAASVGISGTPAYLINGRKISGAQPYNAFKTILDEELARN